MRKTGDFDTFETYAVDGKIMNEILSQLEVAYELSCSGGQFLIEELQHKLATVQKVDTFNEKQHRERQLDSPT